MSKGLRGSPSVSLLNVHIDFNQLTVSFLLLLFHFILIDNSVSTDENVNCAPMELFPNCSFLHSRLAQTALTILNYRQLD